MSHIWIVPNLHRTLKTDIHKSVLTWKWKESSVPPHLMFTFGILWISWFIAAPPPPVFLTASVACATVQKVIWNLTTFLFVLFVLLFHLCKPVARYIRDHLSNEVWFEFSQLLCKNSKGSGLNIKFLGWRSVGRFIFALTSVFILCV